MLMPVAEPIVNGAIRLLLHTLCRVDKGQLEKIPPRGPAILITNHTTSLEGPIYYVLMAPRPRTALGKQELWDNFATRFLMQLWGIIPIARGRSDRRALNRARSALRSGMILGVAPEGTRSSSGVLQRGRPGAALLATAEDVPLIPVVQWGIEGLWPNLRRLRRTPLHIRVGEPFRLALTPGKTPGHGDLRRMSDELMYQLAVMLPARYRGVYENLDEMTTDFIRRPAD